MLKTIGLTLNVKHGVLGLLVCLFYWGVSLSSYAHGVVSSSASITVRPQGVVELKIQFDLTTLLNNMLSEQAGLNLPSTLDEHQHSAGHASPAGSYKVSTLAALNDQQFSVLYVHVIKQFETHLKVHQHKNTISLNKRYPSQSQVFALIKREFIESMMSDNALKNIPYTYDKRRHYQVFYFDFKQDNGLNTQGLKIDFPAVLGDINVTYSESKTAVLHQNEVWVR